MFKFAMTTVLSLMMFAAVAASDQLTTTPAAAHKLQVIIKNESIAPGTCRIHFEDASTKDVACAPSAAE
ncbi:hypothetical protein [Thiothrix nivea]|uniref:Uncharacterized protein n=1 Tax=Thiothrix nivea (strain ATCC 35100 / DSM 5205 / JP2) TaxID=870187 RepID=A0A656HL08_THINJ|nr:hypothetical protein [Thiothrix nivea]EIJ35705.1 hypothetical protein Thini_3182 [Thiothrix nivea DSM 5205]